MKLTARAKQFIKTNKRNLLKHTTIAFLTLVLVTLLIGCSAKGSAKLTDCFPEESAQVMVNKADVADVVKGNNEFGLSLYARLSSSKENLFFSPYSISTALAMTYAGARGQTAKQMAEVFHFLPNQQQLHPAFGSLIKEINGGGSERTYQLSVANALWSQKDYNFLKDFLEIACKNYNAGLNEVDFNDTAGAAKTINKWVSDRTNGKIDKLLSPSDLEFAKLVLTNAIYFKGRWEYKFKKEDTRDDYFEVTADRKVAVQMMHQTRDFEYLDGDNFQALELPYYKQALSMIILLPKNKAGLPSLESALTADNLAKWLSDLSKEGVREVEVYFPKFKMAPAPVELSKELSEMGMPVPFSDEADFSGITGRNDLKISKVIHKAYVDVNEEGTEAAAATGVVVGPTAIAVRPEHLIFRADHPFIFLIRDNKTGSILFMGRMMNPSE